MPGANCLDADGGSPAWAGIDPKPPGRPSTSSRFPRVGGDRPLGDYRIAFADGVPPRGRG